MKQSTIKVGNDSIAVYESEGSALDALLIHGNSLSGETFFNQINSPVGEKFHLLAIDLPGHGNSSQASDPENTYSLPGYAKIIGKLISRLKLKNPVLVGHSLGGHIVLEAVEKIPGLKGIFIFGTPPVGNISDMGKAFLPDPALPYIFEDELTDGKIQLWISALFNENYPISGFISKNMKNTGTGTRSLVGKSINSNNFKNEIEIVSQLKHPIAIVHGTNDRLINLNYIRKLDIPTLWKGKIQVIQNAGHSPQLEKPDEFNNILSEFLEDVTG